LLALLDGRALPAGELAREAGVSAPAASLHLAKLIEGGLLHVRKQGRHRLYSLASRDVAHALEALGVIATAAPPLRSLAPARAVLRRARTCYDHLAGELAVALAQKLEHDGAITTRDETTFAVTRAGELWLRDRLQLELSALPQRRVLARRCPDWTERRPHIAGALGAAILERLLALRWLRTTSTPRLLQVTPRGEDQLAQLLGLRARAI
ncbi:MAG TPA: helix-turn-helix domain-containing protein, partial [Polyangiales bacterium]|nr:helix-turn-helix domain-containing protein [Polyangiales bacterium]